MTFVTSAGNCNFGMLYRMPGAMCIKGFFNVQEYRNCGYAIFEVHIYIFRETHILECRAVTRTKSKLTHIKQAVVSRFF
jgi:hypothetical protein